MRYSRTFIPNWYLWNVNIKIKILSFHPIWLFILIIIFLKLNREEKLFQLCSSHFQWPSAYSIIDHLNLSQSHRNYLDSLIPWIADIRSNINWSSGSAPFSSFSSRCRGSWNKIKPKCRWEIIKINKKLKVIEIWHSKCPKVKWRKKVSISAVGKAHQKLFEEDKNRNENLSVIAQSSSSGKAPSGV